MSLGESACYRSGRSAHPLRRNLGACSPMYMSVIAREAGSESYSELAGARVMLSGLSTIQGVDLARAFAERQARLVIQTDERSPEMVELIAFLASTAGCV